MGIRVLFFKNQGFALLEVLIGAAMFLVLAIAAGSYFTKSKDFAMKIEGSAECRGQIESLLAQYKDSSNLAVTNFIPDANTTGSRSFASIASVADYATPVTGTNQYRNFQNIENSTTRAFLLLNSDDANYCSAADGMVVNSVNKAKIFKDTVIVDKIMSQGKTISFKIEPFDFSTQSTLSCSNRSISPASTANSAHEKGLQLQVKIVTTATNETCVGSALLKYNMDNRRPASAGNTLAAQNCGLGGNAISDEPGSIFTCSLDNVNFALCDNSHIGSLGLPLYSTLELQNGGPGQSNTVAYLGIGGFPDNGNTVTTTPVYIKAVDSSGNREAASTTVNVTCCVDNSWLPDAPGPGGTCVGSFVGTTSNCGNPGESLPGTLCGGGCPTTTQCEGDDSVTRNNCGTEIGRAGGACAPATPCLSSSACDGAGNMVTRDCNNVITSTVPDATCVACSGTASDYCSGLSSLHVDTCGVITVNAVCDPACGSNTANCEGANRVSRDACGTVLSTVVNDPTCSVVPHNFTTHMFCGNVGCAANSIAPTDAFISLLGTVPFLDNSGVAAARSAFNAASQVDDCMNGSGWGGNYSNSGSSGGISWSFTASQTEDAFYNPYRTQFGACDIRYTVWW